MNRDVTTLDKADESVEPKHVATDSNGKRLKTYGERKFDWITYGGFALLGNEITSLFITNARENWAKKYYEPFEKLFTGMKGKYVPEYAKNGGLPKVLVALIGGMLMVPFVKHMEDHKGEKVREYDRKHYGRARSDSDPAIVAAHEEMDQSPKQSWGSLWKGRIVTVLAAIGVDGSMGWKDAPSTKLVEKITKPDSAWRNYSSMDRIATQVSDKTMNVLGITGEASRKTWGKWLQTGSWLLVLSSTLTLLFYASSKVFAKKRDEKIERREHRNADGTWHDDTPEANARTEAPATIEEKIPEKELPKVEQRPKPQVSAVAHEQTLAATAPQRAAGA